MKKVFLYAGIALFTIAIFAQQIGIDNDEGWGRGRIIMLSSGIGLILTGSLLIIFQKRLGTLKKYVSNYLNFSQSTQIALISSVAACIVIIIHTWYSQPVAKDLENSYNYYSELAIGFKAGHLYLTEEPSSALLSFSNPYDYFLRKEHGLEDFPWDVSLYNKKFYVYWGPVPSLILTLFSKERLSYIGDHYIALLFAYGLFLYSSLIILRYWSTSLKHLSSWLLGSVLLVIGLITPGTIMLKEARIYEAAIFGCQFFFIGGCYWVYSSFDTNRLSLWKLAFAGLHWAFALGTRITVAPVILFSTAVTVFYIFKLIGIGKPKSYLPLLAALGIPLVVAISSLGWYNWARFGSVFEFGIKYQLTNVDYNVFKNSFSLNYMAKNLYNYFLHPLKSLPRFPYITRIEYPASNDRLGGLIYLSPYILLIFAPLLRIFNNFQTIDKRVTIEETKEPDKIWLTILLAGSAFIGMFTILTFYFVTMRYIEDFMPSLVLLTTIQFMQGMQFANQKAIMRRFLAFTTIILSIVTITANLMIAMPNSGITYTIELLNSMSKLLGLK
ncbi:MAG: hypothetical protein JNM02_00685 [Anaerolineales bacterium]|nr:hypothetical protein [Anaerolineales bacterium]